MPPELWTKMIADTPLLAVLLLVLWKGGDKMDKIGEKFDKMTLAVKSLSSKVELIGKLQDVRLDLHEERTNGHHPTNGAAGPTSTRHATTVWPDKAPDEDEG